VKEVGMSRNKRINLGRKPTVAAAATFACEMLERRRLLSIINWTNRGTAGNDQDNFGAVFGGLANQARAVVDAVVTSWSRVITHFNYSNGSDTYNLSFSMAANPLPAGGTSVGAGASPPSNFIGNKPQASAVTINWRSGITPGTNSAAGWYLDPTPLDNSEFTSVVNAFVATPTANLGGADLYTVLLHEVGHAMGLYSNPTINAFATDTGVVDTVNTPASTPPSDLWTFNSPNVNALWTAWNSSGGNSTQPATNSNGAEHYAPTGTQVGSYFGATALMNAQGGGGRALIDDNIALMLQDAYGYTITRPSTDYLWSPGGTYYVRQNPNGSLYIGKPGSSNNNIHVYQFGAQIFAQLTIGSPVPGIDPSNISMGFLASSVTGIDIEGGAGNENITVERFPDYSSIPITVNGGGGNDTLTVSGVGSDAAHPVAITATSVTGGYTNITNYSAIEQLKVEGTSGDDVFNVTTTFIPITIAGNGGNDIVNLGNSATNNGAQGVIGNVQVLNDASFDHINIIDAQDADPQSWTMGMSGNSGYVQGARTGAFSWDVHNVFSVSLTTGTGADTTTVAALWPTNNLTITNTGGLDQLNIGAGASASAVRSTVTISSPIGVSQLLTMDDSTDTTGRTVSLGNNGAYDTITGLTTFATNFQHVTNLTILGGNGNDSFSFAGDVQEPLAVNAGGGDDAFYWNAASNVVFNGLGYTTYPVTLDGGSGFNSLTPDDRSRGGASYSVYPDRIRGFEPLTNYEDFSYHNMGFATLYTSQAQHCGVDVYGVGSDIAPGFQMTIFMGDDGGDGVTVHPHDANGNLTINGNLGISGGLGTDSVFIDDTGSTNAINYVFSNPFGPGTQDIGGMGTGLFGFSTNFETVEIDAGEGDDTFTINSYQGPQSVLLHGDGGSDTLALCPNSKNLIGNITNIQSLAFTGGSGFDFVDVSNDASTAQWTYTRTAGSLRMQASGLDLTLLTLQIEELNVTGGTQADVFNVLSTGTLDTYQGLGGNDTAIVGNGGVTQGITNQVITLTENLTVNDGNDATARTVHVNAYLIGQTTGDNLFGVGGYLRYTGTASTTIILGTGGDTAYARPSQFGTIEIFAASSLLISNAVDTLNLALAGLGGYFMVVGTSSHGVVTFGNTSYQPLSFDFFAQRNVDDVAPQVSNSTFTFDAPTQSIDLQFSENVPVSSGDLSLVNTTTGLPFNTRTLQATYDSVTNTAHFACTPTDLCLPDGNYQASVGSVLLTDNFGNPLGASDATGGMFSTYTTSFFIFRGDTNHDRSVNVSDLADLAGNFGKTSGMLWHSGDFDYNGNVNVADLADLAGNFGKMLASGTSGSAATDTLPVSTPSVAHTVFSNQPLSTSSGDSRNDTLLFRRRRLPFVLDRSAREGGSDATTYKA
jgi:hypothetical protein